MKILISLENFDTDFVIVMNSASSIIGDVTSDIGTPNTTRNNKRQASDSPTFQSPPTSRSKTEDFTMSLTPDAFVALLSNADVAAALQTLIQTSMSNLITQTNEKIAANGRRFPNVGQLMVEIG